MTKLNLFDYELPSKSIAQYPCTHRDASRLLVVDRKTDTLEDKQFFDLVNYLDRGDVLVLNNSRVIHSRLIGTKQSTGAQIELFLIKHDLDNEHHWEALARPARRLKAGDVVVFEGRSKSSLSARIDSKDKNGFVAISLDYEGELFDVLREIGHVPLPPYINRSDEDLDETRYQTVFAKDPGSVAAPTAGLHFTPELLRKLQEKGIELAEVTLHVGLGTFRPVQTDEIENHEMHEEFYHIAEDAADIINRAKREKRRIISVGTTSLRTLESAAIKQESDAVGVLAGWGSTSIFIYPGSKNILITDALLTNFHLPKSTLLMLVSAFYDREKILLAYHHAINKGYRFFSYGDAMLLL